MARNPKKPGISANIGGRNVDFSAAGNAAAANEAAKAAARAQERGNKDLAENIAKNVSSKSLATKDGANINGIGANTPAEPAVQEQNPLEGLETVPNDGIDHAYTQILRDTILQDAAEQAVNGKGILTEEQRADLDFDKNGRLDASDAAALDNEKYNEFVNKYNPPAQDGVDINDVGTNDVDINDVGANDVGANAYNPLDDLTPVPNDGVDHAYTQILRDAMLQDAANQAVGNTDSVFTDEERSKLDYNANGYIDADDAATLDNEKYNDFITERNVNGISIERNLDDTSIGDAFDKATEEIPVPDELSTDAPANSEPAVDAPANSEPAATDAPAEPSQADITAERAAQAAEVLGVGGADDGVDMGVPDLE